MINAIKEEINIILRKIYKYPELFAKIGIDTGENAIVQFGYEQLSPIDILGYRRSVIHLMDEILIGHVWSWSSYLDLTYLASII